VNRPRSKVPWHKTRPTGRLSLLSAGCGLVLLGGAVALGCEFAGQPYQLFQVGEELAGHLDAVGEELVKQLGCGYVPGLTSWGYGWPGGHEGPLSRLERLSALLPEAQIYLRVASRVEALVRLVDYLRLPFSAR